MTWIYKGVKKKSSKKPQDQRCQPEEIPSPRKVDMWKIMQHKVGGNCSEIACDVVIPYNSTTTPLNGKGLRYWCATFFGLGYHSSTLPGGPGSQPEVPLMYHKKTWPFFWNLPGLRDRGEIWWRRQTAVLDVVCGVHAMTGVAIRQA